MTTSNPSLHTLANGWTILLEENHSAPVVSLNILVKVGSAMETKSEAGISHFIEHMLFKGTPTRAVGEIARDVEAAGGDINAYTSFDQTVYYINMASRFADDGLAILTDAVQHSLFDPEEITRESEVICEEIRRGEDNPSHQLSEHLFAHTYGDHPYGRPIIGTDQSVRSFRQADLRDYWQRWYTPRNMTLIVVGDFDRKKMLQKIETLCGGAAHGPAPAAVDLAREIRHAGPRVFHHRANIQCSYFGTAFPIPHITHPDVPALDLLAHILGGGESSRLAMEVHERQQLVQSIYAAAYTPRGSGIFLVGGTATTAKTALALAAAAHEVERMASTPVHAAELARAKLNILSGALYERETVGGQGGKYAYMLATTGDYNFEEQYFEGIRAITPEQICAAVKKYLRPECGTLTWLAPNAAKLPKPVVAHGTRTKKSAPTPEISRTMRTPKPVVFTLKNGLRCVLRTDHRLPIISTYLTMLGGTRYENAKNSGISALLASVITKSTAHRDVHSMAESIDAMAGDFSAGMGYNTFGLRADFLSEKLSEGFALLGEILLHPAFDRSEIEKEKQQLLEAIKNREDNLPALAMLHFARALYGHHPYALSRIGHAASVRSLNATALERFYRTLMNPRTMVFGIAGDLDHDSARALAEKYLGALSKQSLTPPKIPALKPVVPQHIVTHRANKQQAHIIYGMRATTVGAKDRYAFAVLNQVLAGQGGRLFRVLRDQMSLAYAVSASHQLGIDPGFFTVYIGTEPAKVETALAGIKTQLALIASVAVSAEEMHRAQHYLVGTYELDLQRVSSVASHHALSVLYNLGLDDAVTYPERILKVTTHDLLAVAKKYLRPDRAVCSIVRP